MPGASIDRVDIFSVGTSRIAGHVHWKIVEQAITIFLGVKVRMCFAALNLRKIELASCVVCGPFRIVQRGASKGQRAQHADCLCRVQASRSVCRGCHEALDGLEGIEKA